jgi:thiosulfate/3-mercaptopyruvate sulfurtransferase
MRFQTLISTTELSDHLGDDNWVILDCRFSLDDAEKGRRGYLKTHIAGALYADLDLDLSDPVIPGVTGRHPLPTIEKLAAKFSCWGIDETVQLVCYDDAGGSMAASRAWWLSRWLGHKDVAVLDGGWQKWTLEDLPTRSGQEAHPSRHFVARPQYELMVSAVEVDRLREDDLFRILDARPTERYHGINETKDPVAGHIPGAISAACMENLSADLSFKSTEELRKRFQGLVGQTPSKNIVVYCGSGVTAAHDILALQYAGLGEARLYPGSWSEWITDPERPVTT